MANSDKSRLARIDEQIIDVQYLYQRELDREAELQPERRHLLASRGFKYRLDGLYSQRALLRKTTASAPTKAMNYYAELSRRKTVYEDTLAAYEDAKKVYMDKIANIAIIGLNLDNELDLKCMRREIGAMKSLVSSKNRAVNNWIAKGMSYDGDKILVPQQVERAQMPELPAIAISPQMRIEDMSGDMQEIARASAKCTAASGASTNTQTPVEASAYSASFALLNSQPTPDAFAFTRSDIEHTVDTMTLANIAVDVEVEPERDAEYIKFMQGLAVESEEIK